MKALVLTTSWPVRAGAMSGSFVRDLLRGLTAHGVEFEVVTPAPRGPVEDLDEPGIRVHVVPHPGAGARLVHGRGLPETLAAAPWTWTLVPPLLAALGRAATMRVRERRFDLVWSHWLLPSGWIGAGIARTAGLPHRITAHGSDIHSIERLARIPGMRTVMARAWRSSALSATSHTAGGRIARVLPGRRVAVCPLPAAPGTARPEPGPPALLFLGRFEPIKGPDLLLEASATLAAGDLARVTLAGSGSLDDRLRGRARHIPHPVEFPGVIGGADKRSALERAHALVIPSRRMPDGRADGLPHAALEALAVGTPVIASRRAPARAASFRGTARDGRGSRAARGAAGAGTRGGPKVPAAGRAPVVAPVPCGVRCVRLDGRIALVVPARDEARLLPRVLATVPQPVWRVVVVDDDSRDGTWEVLSDWRDPRLVRLRTAHRLGVGGAILCGYREALALGADAAVVVAGDAQMDFADLAGVIAPLAAGRADYVQGVRARSPAGRRAKPSATASAATRRPAFRSCATCSASASRTATASRHSCGWPRTRRDSACRRCRCTRSTAVRCRASGHGATRR